MNIFIASKSSLDLFVTTENCTLLILDECIYYPRKLKVEFINFFSHETIVKGKKVFSVILKITLITKVRLIQTDLTGVIPVETDQILTTIESVVKQVY